MSEPEKRLLPDLGPERAATQRDVARLAGVDRATVSRAMDPVRRNLLTPDTVQRVLSAVEALGYRPNSLAQGLRRQRSHIVSLSVPRSIRRESTDFIEGVEDRLRRDRVALLVTFDQDARLLRSSQGLIDGSIVLIEAGALDQRPASEPTVNVGFEPTPGLDVLVDSPGGVAIAVEHLYRLGHRRIALLSEPESTLIGMRHRHAFGAVTASLPGVDPVFATFLPSRPSSAPEACLALLSRATPPTAIVVTDDAAATGCYGAIRTTGRSVPDDVSLVGYGDSAVAPFLLPPLTTIAVPARAAGRRAAHMLLAKIAALPVDAATLTPHLVQRGSTTSPSGTAAGTASG